MSQELNLQHENDCGENKSDVRKNTNWLSQDNGGLMFIALQFNIKDKRKQLRLEKKLSPTEYFLIEEIEAGTIGARNEKREVCSSGDFYLEDLAEAVGIRMDKLYIALKSIQQKGFILRHPTRSKLKENIGLNPDVFGQLLINKMQDREKTKHLKLVHNSPKHVDNFSEKDTQKGEPKPDPGRVATLLRGALDPKRVGIDSQVPETTQEKVVLECIRVNKSVLEEKSESVSTLSGFGNMVRERGINPAQIKDDPEAERRRQLEAFQKFEADELKKKSS